MPAVGGRDHLARKQEQRHRLEIEAKASRIRGKICLNTTRYATSETTGAGVNAFTICSCWVRVGVTRSRLAGQAPLAGRVQVAADRCDKQHPAGETRHRGRVWRSAERSRPHGAFTR